MPDRRIRAVGLLVDRPTAEFDGPRHVAAPATATARTAAFDRTDEVVARA